MRGLLEDPMPVACVRYPALLLLEDTSQRYIGNSTSILPSGDSWNCAALILAAFVGFPVGAELNVDGGLRLDLACLQFRKELQDWLFEDFKRAVADPCIEVKSFYLLCVS